MEVKPGYKQTKIGLIPEDWNVASLAEVCQMKSGDGITSAHIDQFSKYPCYGGNGLRGFTSRFTHDGRYALIGRQGALCGNVLGVEGKFFASEHAIVVTPSTRTEIRWLTYVLGQMQLNQYSESSAQPGLSVSKLLSLDLAFPPNKAEQEAVATALSDVDSLLSTLDALIAKKRLTKQGAMQELLTGKKRLPGFSGEWEMKALKDTAPLQRGFDLPTSRLEIGIYPVVYSNGVLNFHASYKVKSPGVVTGRSGTIGKVNYIESDFWPHNTTLWVTDFKGNSPKFIYYLYTFIKLERFGTGSGVPTLNRNDVHAFQVLVPPSHEEQTAIAEVLSDMDAEIATLEARREKTRLLKQGMMQELLTGKTRLL
jgi:type I restriction enzyme, S subunit